MYDAFSRGLFWIGRLLSAVLGFILYPLVTLLKLPLKAAILGILTIIAIPLLSIYAGLYLHSHWAMGWLPSIAGGLLIAGALLGLAVGVLPMAFLFSGIYTLIKTPLDGARIGWNEGFLSLFSNLFRSRQLQQLSQMNQILPLDGDRVSFEEILQRLSEAAVDNANARQPMTEEQFNHLELSELEVAAIKAQRSVLTSQALEWLERNRDTDEISGLVQRYRDLSQRLVDNCPILQDRPERANTILLVKQYRQGQQWLPVPGVSHIFDKASIQRYFVGDLGAGLVGNAIHPLTHDSILNPPDYEGHDTRYVFHHYYVDGSGLSQEMNQITQTLINHLSSSLTDGETLDSGYYRHLV